MELGMSEEEANSIGYRGTGEGSKLAGNSSLWNSGQLENSEVFGTSGFSALPGGNCDYNTGWYSSMSSQGFFWSATDYNSTNSWRRSLFYTTPLVARYPTNNRYGYSIRCVAD